MEQDELVSVSPQARAVITICMMLATLMQALDTTIANVALPYMQGSLSASYDEITWVITSYVVVAAIMIAPVGWLASRFGRKNLAITCITGFTIASMLCGIAQSLPEIVLARMLQGAFGAALVPLGQSTMMDIYPPEKRGIVMSFWGMGVMVGPIVGPTLGGYLTSNLSWRYVFFVNLPFGLFTIFGLLFMMPKRKSSSADKFNWLGFGFLSLGLAALQFALDRGSELDWTSSSVIVSCFVLAGIGFYLFIVHMLMAPKPFLPRELFTDRNFLSGLFTMFLMGLVLLASSTLLAPYLENLLNYPVQQAGLLMAPRGIGTMFAMLIAGRMTNRIDPRVLTFIAYLMLAYSLYLQEGWTPDTSVNFMVGTMVLQGVGLGISFVPLQVVAFYTLSPALRTQASSILYLVRSVGSAIGVALTSAMLTHMTQYEHANLAGFITPFTRVLQNGAISHYWNPATPGGAQALDAMVTMQAQIIAYEDDYGFMLIGILLAIACLFLVRSPGKQTVKLDEMAME